MSILLDGKKAELSEDILKEIDKLTGKKWPQVFRYMESMYRPNPSNQKPDRLRSVTLPTNTVVVTKKGERVPMQWYKTSNFRPAANGAREEVFTPTHIKIEEYIVVHQHEKDLFWYLWNHPFNISGPSAKSSKNHYYHLQNVAKEATDFISKQGLELTAGLSILSREHGMTDDKVREVAAAYYISAVDTLEAEIVRKKLYDIVFAVEKRTGKVNPKTIKEFVELSESDDVVKLKANIQKACDLNIISYVSIKKKWYYINELSVPVTAICPALSQMTSRDDLYDFLKKNADEKKAFIEEVVKAAEQKAVVEE